EAHWLTVDQALAIEERTDPTRLRMELKAGLPARYQHRQRWWQTKPVEEIAPLLTSRNPLDLQDEHWELVIHETYWREGLGKPDAVASSADVPSPVTDTSANTVEPSPPSAQLRNAPETEIRNAVQAEYDEVEKAERKPPNINEIQAPVQERLKAKG